LTCFYRRKGNQAYLRISPKKGQIILKKGLCAKLWGIEALLIRFSTRPRKMICKMDSGEKGLEEIRIIKNHLGRRIEKYSKKTTSSNNH